ncbi:hypothetical protein [Niallia sp. 01092]|uniref:hypothetical protein n=1 Tax=unclassified Niallia TaxID=2837522 RepID=UPI003FD0BF8A
MQRFLFAYTVNSTGLESEFSQVAETEEKARQLVKERVADIEFTDEDDVVIGKLIKTIDATKHYYECEGCT